MIVLVGVAVAWLTGRTVFDLKADDPRIRTYLIGATAISAFVLIVALFRLLFGPTGYFSAVNGKDPDGDGPLGPLFGGADLSFLAIGDPAGLIVAIVLGLVVGFLAYTWARQGEHARLFPVWIGGATTGLVAAMISAPIAAGVFGGVTGGGTDAARRAVPDPRPQRPPIGVRAGPDQRSARQDDQLHGRLPDPRRPADHGPDDVQPRRGHGRRVTPVAG